MSDNPVATANARTRDTGMTLIELLVVISMMGLLIAVVSSALVVTLRQQDNTEGRLNVARAEQVVSMWMPADLSSADVVNTTPQATPCGATVCDGIDLSTGSNVLLLEWSVSTATGTLWTSVSYHFAPAELGDLYNLSRIECTSTDKVAWSCTSITVLTDLPGPPAGATFVPGVVNGAACTRAVDPIPCTRPSWVIIVSEPLAADAIASGPITPLPTDITGRQDANRVIVSINGGGDAADAGGGLNQISITAGGTKRTTIDADSTQGAPSFTEARSRCGGPMTLVIDESGSIGGALGDVKTGVETFVRTLAGTPVKLQLVRFSSRSAILGSTEWDRYFDMTKQADVDALLGAINGLTSSGSTNWEDALFRTFFKADGSVAQIIPDTVVFFTDGVPTRDRQDRRDGGTPYRATPGILPALPVPYVAPWPESNGSNYSQVAFNRADYIANKFRQSVRFVGVGVGNGITGQSTWISDPGYGYRTIVERGSYRYVRDTYRYQGRYQVRNASTGNEWKWVDLVTYNAAPTGGTNGKRVFDWTTITEAQWLAANTRSTDDSNDGLSETVTGSTRVSTVEYTANSSNPAYRAVTKTWSNGPDWEVWTGSWDSDSDQYRTTEVSNSPPYTGVRNAVTAQVDNAKILARLIAGNDTGTPAIKVGSAYTNAEIADMFVLPDWADFDPVMKQIALGECGGTLTLQTKVGGTTPATDPFQYQNSGIKDSAGDPVALAPTVVTTNQVATTGTFDFPVPNGQFVTVDINLQNYSNLGAYTPGAWSCKAGNATRDVVLIDNPGVGAAAWKGIRVKVAANEAVSCTLSVTQ